MSGTVTADRIQFAFTIMFHYLFPIGTMGLAPFVAWYTIRAAQTHDPKYHMAAQFWAKIFVINFVIGVVTGIPMEFQFGTNWALFSARAGAVVGPPLAMEGIYAFFLESIFLGVFFFGRGVVPPLLHTLSAVCIWIGSWLSGFFIVSANAWMQAPVGYTLMHDGRLRLDSLSAVLFSRFLWWQYLHVMTGAVVAGGFLMMGIGAYYVLARRQQAYGALFLRTGVVVAFLASVFAVFPTGDENGNDVTHYQPAKLAAMEGLFKSAYGAPMAIIGMPDTKTQKLIDPIFVPDVLSFLAYGRFHADVKGLTEYAADVRPPVELTYYAYHIMVGLGTIFLALGFVGFVLWRRRQLESSRWFLWLAMLMMPFPYIANEAGWVTTEVGRQPWIVYGLIRTAQGASENVGAGETIFTTIGFLGMYFLLGLLFMLLVLREIGIGPEGQLPQSGPVLESRPT